MSRVESPSLMADQVFRAIREQIMNGSMPAGHRLRVRDLAEQVGTSVMPVREAIRRLEEAGLAERSPHRSTVVKGLTLTELRHVYHVRTLLEVEATRLAAEHVTPAGVENMERACGRIGVSVDAGDVVGALDADEEVLRTLYGFGGNPVLLESIEGLWSRCRVYKIVGARRAIEEDDRSLWSFQPRLVEAARSADRAEAVAITEASMRSATVRIERQLGGD